MRTSILLLLAACGGTSPPPAQPSAPPSAGKVDASVPSAVRVSKIACAIGSLARSMHPRRVIYVGGRVGRDGRVECALATSADAVPEPVRECAAGVLTKARFSPPKSGAGSISIPVKVMAQRRS